MDSSPRRKPVIKKVLTISVSILCLFLFTHLTAKTFKANISTASAATTPSPIDVVSNLEMPTAFDWLPDSSLLILEKNGHLIRFTNNQSQTITTIPVNTHSERGLLGIAVDPDFETNRYIYLFYTTTNAVNRTVRYTLNSNFALGNETILVDNIFSSAQGNHNAGDLHFDTNRNLYVSTGDGGGGNNCGNCSQKIDSPNGKILRINPDTAEGVQGNPFLSNTNATAKKVWALGLRNPHRFDIHPETNNLFIADVGENRFEEINQGIAGANYGWPQVEGPEPANTTGVTYPIFYYSRSGNTNTSFNSCSSITGGAFARGNNFPSELSGNYFFGDYTCGKIWTINPNNPSDVALYASDIGAPVHIAFGPDGAMYYADIANGKIKKLQYTNSQTPIPTVQSTSNPTATRSNNTPPQITITGAKDMQKTLPDTEIRLQATVTDTEDSTINSDNITWNAIRHHGTTHTHPWSQGTGNTFTLLVPQPEDLETAATSYLEITVSAKDSQNVSSTQKINLYYDTVSLTFNSEPTEMKIKLNNIEYTTPITVDAVKGQVFPVEAIDQTKNNQSYQFDNWSTGEAKTHTYTTPTTSQNISVTYKLDQQTPSPTTTPTASPTSTPRTTPITPEPTASPINESSPSPENPNTQTRLIICTFEDRNANGIRNWEDTVQSWQYKLTYNNQEHTVESHAWHIWTQGCAKTKVPVNTGITVDQMQKDNWKTSALYADGARTDIGSYTYTSAIDNIKIIWFLNTKDEVNSIPTNSPTPIPDITSPSPFGKSVLEIYAEGQKGGDAYPSMQILVKDTPVTQIDNINTYTRYVYQHPEYLAVEDIKIQFNNDYHIAEPYDDRNLRVDKIVLDGIVYESENQNTHSTGVWNSQTACTPGNKQDEMLSCNGYFQYKQ